MTTTAPKVEVTAGPIDYLFDVEYSPDLFQSTLLPVIRPCKPDHLVNRDRVWVFEPGTLLFVEMTTGREIIDSTKPGDDAVSRDYGPKTTLKVRFRHREAGWPGADDKGVPYTPTDFKPFVKTGLAGTREIRGWGICRDTKGRSPVGMTRFLVSEFIYPKLDEPGVVLGTITDDIAKPESWRDRPPMI